ncbi:MAG: invasin domain 3-containing protein [Gloeobacterales cyanobacterium]
MKADLLLQRLGLMSLLAGTMNVSTLVTAACAEPDTSAPPASSQRQDADPSVAPSAVAPSVPTEPIPTTTQAQNPQIDLGIIKPTSPPPVTAEQVRILTPDVNSLLDVPAATVTLQFPEGSPIDLQVNGVSVNPNLIGRTETDTKNKLVTQTWYGVPLKEGKNTITAQVKGEALVTLPVMVRGIPKQLTVKPLQAKISADGRSTAMLEGQLLDANGNPSNRDTIVTLTSTAGEFTGADADPDQPGFQVKVQKGEYKATLRSSLEAQTVKVKAKVNELEASSQLEFATDLRPSLVTGVVNLRLGQQGTDFYRSFREFLPFTPGPSNKLDLRSAVFATGKIGDWLFTGAYNNTRSLNQDCNGNSRLFQDLQACDLPYAVFGDSSTTVRTAQSQDSVFLRLERNQDYITWGDYDTQKEFATTSQQLSETRRKLHGLKLNYNFGNLQTSAFYGDNVQGFQRDTIAPDGTSGYYFLSRRLLVTGSEQLFVELEEINRPGTVVDRQPLSRGTDYDIDYDRGTILFRRPLLRTDVGANGQVLVRQLVATYQYNNQENANIYGGRVRYHLSKELNKESWVGATYVKETQGIRQFQLYGADALFTLGPNAKFIAEYAHSENNSDEVGKVNGSAYRLEANVDLSKDVKARAYLRSTETGFANNAAISFVPGQTRYGAEVSAQVSPTTNIHAQYDQEENRGIAPQPLFSYNSLFNPGTTALPGSQVDNSLTTLSAGIQQQFGSSKLELDYIARNREDRMQPETSGSSSQLRSRVTIPLAEKLTFRAQHELNLSSGQNLVYPNRTILGLDWAVYPGIKVQLNQQFFSGGQFGNNSITSIDTVADYKLGENTALTGRYSIIGGASGTSTQGAIGLNHRWVLFPGFATNLTYERVFGDVFANTAVGTQFAQPFTPGQSASSLGIQGGDSYSIGFEYTANPDFKASARYEHRTNSAGSNTVISAGLTGKVSPSLTALLRYNQANTSNQLFNGLGDTSNLKLGLAYRDPNDNRFNALLRYEFRQNPATIPNTLLLGSGTGSTDHTIAVEAIYAPNWQWEFYGKFALRSSTAYLSQDFSNSSLVSLAQLRARYRLGYNTDIVGEIRSINQPTAGYSELGGVAELGYYISPNLRLAAGYSFGRINDRDFSGSRAAEGPYLGITLKLNELFDGFGLQRVAPAQQQESQLAQAPVTPPKAAAEPAPISQTPASVSKENKTIAFTTQAQQQDLAKPKEELPQAPVPSQTTQLAQSPVSAVPMHLKDLQPFTHSAEQLLATEPIAHL